MATDLTFGAVPAFYREVYDILCPQQEQVDLDMFLSLLVKSSLPKSTLSQIWEAADNKQGFLTRTGIYKALALTALAQQGKAISDKLLETFSDQDLPNPNLGDLTDLRHLSIKVRRERNPCVLGYNYHELCDIDVLKIALVPEKRGIILKHVEYEITSQRYKCSVLRRYNDFLVLHDMLLNRFPYRMVPRLPPKKMMGADRDFIEQRRKSLRRFLTLVVRHPVLTDDPIVKYFFTFSGSDMQHKIKEHFKGGPDEFMTCETALNAKEIVPMDTQNQFGHSRELNKVMLSGVTKLRDISERIVQRAQDSATDFISLGKELSILGNDTTATSPWGCGTNTHWLQLKRGFRSIASDYVPLADKFCEQASRIDISIVEGLNIFLDLLQSYQDLCDRHEKGVLHEHQRALQKMSQYKKKHMSASVTSSSESSGGVDQLEKRILAQESHITNMENRNYFSLHCIQMETQLVHANLEGFYTALNALAIEEESAHKSFSQIWEAIKPKFENILNRGDNSPNVMNTQQSYPLHNNNNLTK